MLQKALFFLLLLCLFVMLPDHVFAQNPQSFFLQGAQLKKADKPGYIKHKIPLKPASVAIDVDYKAEAAALIHQR